MKKLVCALLLTLVFSAFVFSTGEQEKTAVEVGPQKLVVWCNAVHKQVADGTRGGAQINIVKNFEAEYNAQVEWITIPWEEMQNKVLRELTFPQGESDIIFIHSAWADRNTVNLLESLNGRMKKDPIEDFDDMAEGLMAPYVLNNNLYGIPYRITLRGLHFNKRIFTERGIQGPPKTQEELMDVARKATYKRADGAQVYGLGLRRGDILTFIRGYGGYVLSPDFEIGCNKPEVIRALEALKSLHKERVIPPNFSVLTTSDVQNLVSEGLAAMASFPDSYYTRFNDPTKSKEAGNLDVAFFPATKEQGLKAAPSDTAIWAACIPKNAKEENKALAYQFIRFFASKDAQLKTALNGNSPVRISTYNAEEFKKDVPYAAVSRETVKTASPNLPTFIGTAQVNDIIEEESSAAIMGDKEVKEAMEEAYKKIEAVLKEAGVK